VPEAFGLSHNKVQAARGMKVIGGKGATMSPFFADARNYSERIAQGYEPVTDEGEIVQQGGDLLMKRPIEFTRQELRRDAEMSKERVKSRDMESEDNEMMADYRKEMKGKEHLSEQTAVATGVAGGVEE
jgi:hypothetical protein